MDIVCPSCAAAYEIDATTVTVNGRKVRCAACNTVWRVFSTTANAPNERAFVVEAGANPYATEPAEDIFGEGGPMLRQAIEEQARHVDEPKTEAVVQDERVSAAAIDALDEAFAAQELAVDEAFVAAVSPGLAQDEPRRAKLTRDRPLPGSGRAKVSNSFIGSLFSWKTASIVAAVAVIGVGVQQRETVVRHVPQTANLFAAIGMQVNLRGVEIRNVASRIIDDNGVNILVIDGDLLNITKRKIDLPRLRFAVRGADGQEVYVWSAQADKNYLAAGENLNFRRRLAAPPHDGKDISVRFLTRADTTAGIK